MLLKEALMKAIPSGSTFTLRFLTFLDFAMLNLLDFLPSNCYYGSYYLVTFFLFAQYCYLSSEQLSARNR